MTHCRTSQLKTEMSDNQSTRIPCLEKLCGNYEPKVLGRIEASLYYTLGFAKCACLSLRSRQAINFSIRIEASLYYK